MGYRGPTPKPSVIEIAEGCPRKRPVNRREPMPRTVAPKCPAHLDELAQKEWRRLVPILRRMRVLTEADGMALAKPLHDLQHDDYCPGEAEQDGNSV